MNLPDLFTAWLAHRARMAELGLIAWSTYGNQSDIAGRLARGLGPVDLAGLRKSHLELYVGTRQQTCQPITIAAELNVLRQALNWAVDEGLLAQRPRFPIVSVPNVEKPLPADADYAWYLRTMPPAHGDALQFMLLTGLSPHELARLQPRDCDDNAGEIVIGGRADFAVKQPSRRRRVPLNQAAWAIWIKWTIGLPADRLVFPQPGTLQKAMRRHFLHRHNSAPAGADGLTPKMMRKWFASKVAAEHSEAVLQRLLGHAPGSPITRKHYVRSTDDQLGRAVSGIAL